MRSNQDKSVVKALTESSFFRTGGFRIMDFVFKKIFMPTLVSSALDGFERHSSYSVRDWRCACSAACERSLPFSVPWGRGSEERSSFNRYFYRL